MILPTSNNPSLPPPSPPDRVHCAGSPEGGPQERGDPGEAAGGDGGLQVPGGPAQAAGARGGYSRNVLNYRHYGWLLSSVIVVL